MKVVWVSPGGEHVSVASRIRDAGHAVVVYGAASDLPTVSKSGLAEASRVADLVVVDGTFSLAKTRRSWKPAQDALFFDEMRRKYGVIALGPTPTVDLLVGDARYLRKMCSRFNVPYGNMDGKPWHSGAWFTATGAVPPGPLLDPFVPLFKAVGFRGWFCLHGVLTPDGPMVSAADASWASDTIPVGKEAEWLLRLSR